MIDRQIAVNHDRPPVPNTYNRNGQ